MLNSDQIDSAAAELFEAERNRTAIDPISLRHNNMDMADAYAIQKCWVDKKIANGQRVIGYKIGLTSRAMQQTMKIDTPDYGVLLDDMLFENNSEISAADFIDPRIEVELAFVLKKRLFGENLSIEEVLDATDYVQPALELIAARSHRVHPDTGYTRNVFDTISDNAANAGIVLGPQKHASDTYDLRWVGAIVSRNGEVEETGLGAGVLNDPVEGIVWLAQRLAKYDRGIEAGQVILSGSFIRPVECTPGSKIHADYGPFGSVDVAFE